MHEDSTEPTRLRWMRRRKGGPRAQEPADLGTAFGMELTLAPRIAADAPDPARAPASPGWLQRWRSAGRPAS